MDIKQLNKFNFMVSSDDDSGDIEFILAIDEVSLRTYITSWSNSWKAISSSLEEYIFTGHAQVELDFDTEPTVVEMTKENSDVLITVTPSHFTKEPPFSGRCEEQDFLRKFYDGLLYAMTYCYDEIGCGRNWDYCKMVCYNMMKSRTVEKYLNKGVVQRETDYVAKHVLVIQEKEILHICDETIGYHIPIVDNIEVTDKSGNVIAVIDGTDIQLEKYRKIADSLSTDFDLWLIPHPDETMIAPLLIMRSEDVKSGQIFNKGRYKVLETGNDPYGFTTETLWTACNKLDKEKVIHFINLNADTTYLMRWLLNSNLGGTHDIVGNFTFEETEVSMRSRDERKADIIKSLLSIRPNITLKEEDLRLCVWNYCPTCLRILLEHGANPNEKTNDKYWKVLTVKYRSVLSLTNCRIKDGHEKYGILEEIKETLETYGAEDCVIINEDYPHKGGN